MNMQTNALPNAKTDFNANAMTNCKRLSDPKGDEYPLTGKTAVITGATSGIGLAAATELAKLGARVIAVGRSAVRCAAAAEQIMQTVPGAAVDFLVCDLSSLTQVRTLAAEIETLLSAGEYPHLDVLINNAGTVSSWYVATPDGYELQFAVNHLAPFLLTNALLPLLKAAPSARVITVSSGSHYRTRIHWKDVFLRRHYSCLTAYKQSKLANVLFSEELNRRFGPTSRIRAFAADPGLVHTSIGLKGTAGIERWVWDRRSKGGDAPEKPAKAIAWLASDPSVPDSGRVYWKDCRPRKPSRYARNPQAAARLWELSEKLCGI